MFFFLLTDDPQKAGPSGLTKIKTTLDYDEDDDVDDDDGVYDGTFPMLNNQYSSKYW